MKWSIWYELNDKNVKNTPKTPAVYEIRLVSSDGKLIPIDRFLGIDPGGILTIGSSKDIQRRIKQFRRGMRTRDGHSEGNLLNILLDHSVLKRVYSKFIPQFHYVIKKTKKATQKVEEKLIKTYVKEHGEVPPLNSVIPDRYNRKSWE